MSEGTPTTIFPALFKVRAESASEPSPKTHVRVIDGYIRFASDLPLAVIGCDRDGVITHWSRYAGVLFGLPTDVAVGRKINSIGIQAVDASEEAATIDRFRNRLNWRGELTVKGRFGADLRLHAISTPLVDDDGVICGMGGLFLDVTAYRSDLTQQAATLREIVFYGEEIIELERARIARDLHDDLGQKITAMKSEARQRMTSGDADAARQGDELRITQACDDLIDGIHRICAELTTPVLDDFGLVDALESLAFEVADHIGARCSFDFGEVPEMDKRLRREVFRIAQQALINAERHSKATQISVSLQQVNDSLVLQVTDDGVGIDSIGPDDFGLQTMRERAERLAGSLRIHRHQPHGTVVAFSLPLAQFEATPVSRRIVSRTFVEAIMRATGDMTIVFNPDGTLQWVKSWTSIEGPGEWVDSLEAMMTLVHPEDRSLAFQRIVNLLTGTSMEERWVRIRIKGRDGDYTWYEADGRNLVNVPEVGGVVVSLREVTQRPVLETEREHLRRYNETLVLHMSEPTATLDPNGKITFCNQALSDLFDLAFDEVVGTTIYDYIFDTDHNGQRERLMKRRLGISEMYPLRLKLPKGEALESIVTAISHLAGGELELITVMISPLSRP